MTFFFLTKSDECISFSCTFVKVHLNISKLYSYFVVTIFFPSLVLCPVFAQQAEKLAQRKKMPVQTLYWNDIIDSLQVCGSTLRCQLISHFISDWLETEQHHGVKIWKAENLRLSVQTCWVMCPCWSFTLKYLKYLFVSIGQLLLLYFF